MPLDRNNRLAKFYDALEMTSGEALSADVCVVGGGAAGITLALELANTRLDVLLLESGGLENEPETQRLYEGSVADENLHSPPDRYRQRRFGGSTTIWGGRCVPLDAIDFETRDYIPLSGWPLQLETLLPYYRRANTLCEAGAFQYSTEEAFSRSLRPMIDGFVSDRISTNTLERISCPTDFGARYRHKLVKASNVRVVLHANLTKIHFRPDGRTVESLTAQSLDGRTLTVRAQQVILAVGGLEVPRILLANRDVWKQGIGNTHDVVGRYYMCHISGSIGTLKPKKSGSSIWHGYDISDDGVYCRRRLALMPGTQRQMRLGNFVARLHHQRITDPSHRSAVLSSLQLAKGMISYEYGKRLHGDERAGIATWMAHARNILSAPWEVIAFGQHMVRDRFLAERKFPSIIVQSAAGNYALEFHAEQVPSASSRIHLTDDRDALGVPKLCVDWNYQPEDVRTVRESVRLFADEVLRSGVGSFEYDPQTIELEMARYGAYGGHHLGTARMGTDPKTSVVDSDCRVHGMENLYVAGGAVFPTSSQANPTLTIVALAVRLAEAIRHKLRVSDAMQVTTG
jgi:choline dehydrogenase-like flavoprotein